MHLIFIPSWAMQKKKVVASRKCTFGHCQATFDNDILLFAHLKMHKECDGTLLACANTTCGQLFFNKAQRNTHYTAPHPELIKDLKPIVRKTYPKKGKNGKGKKVKFDIPEKIKETPIAHQEEIALTPVPATPEPVASPVLQITTAAIIAGAKITPTSVTLPVILKRKTAYQKFCELESSIDPRYKDVEESYSALPKPISKKRLKAPKKRVIAEPEVEIIKEVVPVNRYGCCQRFVNQHPSEYKLHALRYHPEAFLDVHDPDCSVCARHQGHQKPANGSSSVPFA